MTHNQRTPQPFELREPIDYEDAREALRELGRRRTVAREELESATEELVDAERDYRKGRATKRVEATSTTAADRKDEIDSATADLRHTRDGKEWKVKIIQEKLEEIDAQRASVHRLVDWSMKLDPFVAENQGRKVA